MTQDLDCESFYQTVFNAAACASLSSPAKVIVLFRATLAVGAAEMGLTQCLYLLSRLYERVLMGIASEEGSFSFGDLTDLLEELDTTDMSKH
jgi:hypothetical protein|tara:strand:+ start:173 stop:448 length:276 start_codon:yes stop_codon:yes gene_type:complete